MMRYRKLLFKIFRTLIGVPLLLMISPPLLAIELHEDPDLATLVFSGVALLRYYAEALDFVLQKNPVEVEARLGKMPWANVPTSLDPVTKTFATSSINLSYQIAEIDKDLNKLRILREQSRFVELIEQAKEVLLKLSQAYSELGQVERATETTGNELKVASLPAGSDLRVAYDEVLERIKRIKEMLALYWDLLANLLLVPETKEGLAPETKEELVKKIEELVLEKKGELALEKIKELVLEKIKELVAATAITLKIEPMVAFVGDEIRFEGRLTSDKEPLAGRAVDILIDGSRYMTATTDVNGYFRGTLVVPYRYLPEMNLQALYYPRGKDVGLYSASLSPVVKLKVLFYESRLEVRAEGKAYPGLEAVISGKFDYGQAPPLSERRIEIYFDDVLLASGVVPEVFTQKIRIGSQAEVGEHSVTVSSAAVRRYSPVVDSIPLKVTKASPILDLGLPKLVVIPGSFEVRGKLYSEVGPLSKATIKMGLGRPQVEVITNENGVFVTKIKTGIGLGLIGWQNLAIQVLPQEPWHTPLVTTKSVFIVNVMNGFGLLVILFFLGVYLPRRLRVRLGPYPRRETRPEGVVTESELMPTVSKGAVPTALKKEDVEREEEPESRIFYYYRLVARLILSITKALLKPQQTLREFAEESRAVLGPVAKYFFELTKKVERLLYSRYRPTEEDVAESQKLSHSVEEGLKGEGI